MQEMHQNPANMTGVKKIYEGTDGQLYDENGDLKMNGINMIGGGPDFGDGAIDVEEKSGSGAVVKGIGSQSGNFYNGRHLVFTTRQSRNMCVVNASNVSVNKSGQVDGNGQMNGNVQMNGGRRVRENSMGGRYYDRYGNIVDPFTLDILVRSSKTGLIPIDEYVVDSTSGNVVYKLANDDMMTPEENTRYLYKLIKSSSQWGHFVSFCRDYGNGNSIDVCIRMWYMWKDVYGNRLPQTREEYIKSHAPTQGIVDKIADNDEMIIDPNDADLH